MEETPYCEHTFGQFECGEPVDKWGQFCAKHRKPQSARTPLKLSAALTLIVASALATSGVSLFFAAALPIVEAGFLLIAGSGLMAAALGLVLAGEFRSSRRRGCSEWRSSSTKGGELMGIKSSSCPSLAPCRYCHRKDLKAFGARSPEKLAQMRRLLAEARKHPVKRSRSEASSARTAGNRAQQLSEAERRDLAEFPVDMSYGGSVTTDATQRVEDYASARAQQLSEAAQQLESGFVGALAAVTGISAAELRRLGF